MLCIDFKNFWNFSLQAVAHKDWDPATSCLPTPAAVDVRSSREIRFDGCVFRNLGATGVHFWSASQDNAVTRSTFVDLSASAVLFGSVNTYLLRTTVHCHEFEHQPSHLQFVHLCERFRAEKISSSVLMLANDIVF
jgi:hypothetical protein